MSLLRDALAPIPGGEDDTTGWVTRVYTSADGVLDGRVDVSMGGGQTATALRVMESSWTPVEGRLVSLLRYPDGQRLVLGPVRSTNPAPVRSVSLAFPFNVRNGTPAVANPLIVNVSATGSWRSSDGWAGGYMPTPDTVAQGSYSASSPFYRGCYFYGDVFGPLAGRRCTSLGIRIHRLGSGGTSGATQQVIGPHVHASQPGGEPLYPWDAANVGALAWNQAAWLALPEWWGDLLINRQAFGFGHLLLAFGNGNQSYAAGIATDGATGQLSLGWA